MPTEERKTIKSVGTITANTVRVDIVNALEVRGLDRRSIIVKRDVVSCRAKKRVMPYVYTMTTFTHHNSTIRKVDLNTHCVPEITTCWKNLFSMNVEIK